MSPDPRPPQQGAWCPSDLQFSGSLGNSPKFMSLLDFDSAYSYTGGKLAPVPAAFHFPGPGVGGRRQVKKNQCNSTQNANTQMTVYEADLMILL